MSESIAESRSAELIEKHRELNKMSGAKSHLATPSTKSSKLKLKDETARRARENCDECCKYLQSHEHTGSGETSHAVFQPHSGHGADAAFGHGVPADFVSSRS